MEQKFQQIGTEIERFRLECIYMERKNDRLPIFTERFRELQGEKSNTEFADFLGISRQTVGFYCNGDRVPDALTLVKISQKCGVSADWLLGLSPVPSPDIDVKDICKQTGLSEKSVICLKKHCGTRNNDFVLALIDNLLIEDEWVEWQARARRAALYQAKSEMRKPLKDARDQFIEILLREMSNARFPLVDQDISDTVEIPLQSASDLYCNQVVKKIDAIVLKTIEAYKEHIKDGFEVILDHPLDSTEKQAIETEMKLALYAALQAFDKVLDEDEQVSK